MRPRTGPPDSSEGSLLMKRLKILMTRAVLASLSVVITASSWTCDVGSTNTDYTDARIYVNTVTFHSDVKADGIMIINIDSMNISMDHLEKLDKGE